MRIHLFRPSDPLGPWLVIDENQQVHAPLSPTPELIYAMPKPNAWFEAERLDEGWDIKGRASNA